MVWKMIFLFKQVIFRFHVIFRGVPNLPLTNIHPKVWWFPIGHGQHIAALDDAEMCVAGMQLKLQGRR